MGHRTPQEIMDLAPIQTVNGQPGPTVTITPANIGATTPSEVSSQISSEATAAVAAATEVLAGKAEIATQVEADAGTDDARFISPLKGAVAYLRKIAGDFATFTAKASPVAADILLIEDSEATGAKKKVQLGALFGSNGFKRLMSIPIYGAAGFGRPYGFTTSGTYTVISRFVFPGTALTGSLTSIIANLFSSIAGVRGDIRVYDATNSLQIAQLIGSADLPTNPGIAAALVNLGTLSNLPTGRAVFEVQIRRTVGSGGQEIRCSALDLEF